MRALWLFVFSINYFRKKKKSPLGPRQYDTRAQRANSPSLPPPVGAHTPSRRTNPGLVHCWEKLHAAWEPASVMEAGQLLAAGTLFKDAREAGLEEGRKEKEGFMNTKHNVPTALPSTGIRLLRDLLLAI